MESIHFIKKERLNLNVAGHSDNGPAFDFLRERRLTGKPAVSKTATEGSIPSARAI